MFINFTNHPSKNWGDHQKEKASHWGATKDFPFPNVDANWTEQEVKELANQVAQQIITMKPDAVLCQGEMTLAFQVVILLKAANISTVAACSKRKAKEVVLPDGTVEKYAIFEFVKYREF
ncbi:MAG: hypothetical protein RR415_10475 [Ruthenibacterium sp.]